MQRYPMAFCTLEDVVLQLNYDAAAALGLTSGETAIIAVEDTNTKAFLKKLIIDASDEIINRWHRWFVPVDAVETVYAYEHIWGRSWYKANGAFRFKTSYIEYADLLALSAVSLEGTTLDSANYRLSPSHARPYTGVAFSSSAVQVPSLSDFNSSLALTGTWGYHKNPAGMWQSIGTLAANMAINATSLTLATGNTAIKTMQYLRIGTEYILTTAKTVGSPNDTITIERGKNGSTAAAALSGATIEAYQIMPQVAEATRRHVIRLLRKSPEYADVAIVGEGNVTLDPETIKLSLPVREVWGDV